MLRVLITGANRGLGLEFATQYLRRGEKVFAGCRRPEQAHALQTLRHKNPERLIVLSLDVTNVASIDAAVKAIKIETGALDLVVNNAGVYPHGERPSNLEPSTMLQTYHVNCVGPMMVAQRTLPLLRQGADPKIVNLTSRLGSLTLKQRGGTYSYGSSKAALNMLTRALAFDLKPEGIIVTAVHPGWVQTDMGGDAAPLEPPQAIGGVIDVIDGLTLEDTGRYRTWNGETLPW